jgi:hypothetical protein
MHHPAADPPGSCPRFTVPLTAAKNQLSALIARVERGDGLAAAVQRLQQLRGVLVLEGELRAIAREGLD